MTNRLLPFLALLLLVCGAPHPAHPQTVSPPPSVTTADVLALTANSVKSVNGNTPDASGAVAISLKILSGLYTVQTGGANPLPAAASSTSKLAFVTDWEGGPGFFYSDGTVWRQPAVGKCRIITVQASSPNITLDSLKDTNCLVLLGLVNFALKVNVVAPYDGERLSIRRDQALSQVLGAVGSITVAPSGTANGSMSLTDATTLLQWDAASAAFKQVG